jgi:anthranilate synthase/aminodeoxychorismate synthase-like glutamine amidotransferase
MILLIDNYDSFTYNVYQMLAELGADVDVVRNDKISIAEIESKNYEAIVISPGPGTPDEAGISKAAIQYFAGKKPIFGICLGHQAIGEVFGAVVTRAPQPIHGKVSTLVHSGHDIYQGLPENMQIGRYHSLIVERETLPACLEITSELDDGMIMGIKHKMYPIEGVQFHPESILTPDGRQILKNFLRSLS